MKIIDKKTGKRITNDTKAINKSLKHSDPIKRNAEKDLEIIVEGHTDSDKLTRSTSPKNNWELSVLRATSVVEIILANSQVNPSQLLAAGRGEFYPVSETEKAKNRRIEVIISPNLNELYEIISND